uniref:hypothetical protein n=1 Tax=Lactococcus garvieae TaxID=1363 RepID=UPI00359C1021
MSLGFNIVELLDSFKSFFTFPVPLGVDILLLILGFIGLLRLQESRREDFKTTQKQSDKTNKILQKIIKDKEKTICTRNARITELESRLDFYQKNHTGRK